MFRIIFSVTLLLFCSSQEFDGVLNKTVLERWFPDLWDLTKINWKNRNINEKDTRAFKYLIGLEIIDCRTTRLNLCSKAYLKDLAM